MFLKFKCFDLVRDSQHFAVITRARQKKQRKPFVMPRKVPIAAVISQEMFTDKDVSMKRELSDESRHH